MSNRPDPIRQLQTAARAAARHVNPHTRARNVIVLDVNGEQVLDLQVPAGADADADGLAPAVRPGWDVDDRRALFDGQPIRVAASRLRLLRVLAEAEGPLPAKELARLAFDRESDEENARYHVRELRKELKVAFDGFEGEIIPGDGGYRLVLR